MADLSVGDKGTPILLNMTPPIPPDATQVLAKFTGTETGAVILVPVTVLSAGAQVKYVTNREFSVVDIYTIKVRQIGPTYDNWSIAYDRTIQVIED